MTIALGVIFIVMAIVEARQSATAKKVPQDVACAELMERGYGDNAHVRLSDFYLCTSNYVYEEKIAWTKAWVPAVPIGSDVQRAIQKAEQSGQEPDFGKLGDQIKLIVLLPRARGPKDVELAAQQEVLQGLILHPTRVFTRKTRALLQESYPGLDFQTCLILVEGRKPASKAKTQGIIAGGAALVFVGCHLIVREIRRRRGAEWTVVK